VNESDFTAACSIPGFFSRLSYGLVHRPEDFARIP
jgi:hypothetical protein